MNSSIFALRFILATEKSQTAGKASQVALTQRERSAIRGAQVFSAQQATCPLDIDVQRYCEGWGSRSNVPGEERRNAKVVSGDCSPRTNYAERIRRCRSASNVGHQLADEGQHLPGLYTLLGRRWELIWTR